MSIPIPAPLPPYTPGFANTPNVTPFTYRDGLSYVQKFERLKDYLNRTILPYINEHFTELYDEFTRQVNLMITEVNEALATQDANNDEKIANLEAFVNAQVQAIIEDSIQVQDPVLTGILSDPNSDSRAALDKIYQSTYIMTPERFSGLDNTGVATAHAKINEILAAVPAFSRLQFYGIYNLGDTVNIPAEKFLTLDFDNAKVIATGGHYTTLSCIGTFEAQLTVSSITTETIVMENKSRTVNKLNMGAASTWKRGDRIKVIADNVIPAAHVTSITDKPRVGEFATVYAVSGASVWLTGELTEPFTTSIRAARLTPGSVTINDLTFDWSDARLAAKYDGPAVRLWNMENPKISRPHFKRLGGMGVSTKSNYGYRVEDIIGDFALDDTSTGNLGYWVHDSGCNNGIVSGGTVTSGRHAYTDGVGLVTELSTDTPSYGATLNTKVIAMTGKYQTAANFDTHHMSRGVQFINDTAYVLDEENAFTIRGRDHSIINPIVYGGDAIVRLETQVTSTYSTGETYGINLVNPRSYGTAKVANAGLRLNANHPNYLVRYDTRVLSITGGIHEGLTGIGDFRNVIVDITGRPVWVWGALAVQSGIYMENAELRTGDLYADLSKVTSTTSASGRLIYADDPGASGSIIDIGMFKLSAASATYIANAIRPIEVTNAAAAVHVTDFINRTSWAITAPINGPAGSTLSFKHRRTNANSSRYIAVTNAEIVGDLRIPFASIDEHFTVALSTTDATARTLAILPAGKFQGQRVTLMSVSAVAVTVTHGAGGNTALLGSTSKVLDAVGKAIDLIYTGTSWRQANQVIV
jgi:hypothetical protein